jgi:ketosteroid isomerase-like protein
MSNIETVQSMYAAFGRGDIEAILARLSESVEWEYGVSSTDVPWLQPRTGRTGAAEFFQSLQAFEFQHFQVTLIVGDGDTVIGLCDVEAIVKATGRKFTERDEAHIWTFDAAGMVTRFRHRVDTHLQWLAFHVEGS